jgi:hypothetical protein
MSGQAQNANYSSWHDPSQLTPGQAVTNMDVFVTQSGSGNAQRTVLGYYVEDISANPDGSLNLLQTESGWGTIPNSAVHFVGGAKPSAATLSIDTSTLNGPDFLHWGTGGPISLSWTATSFSSFESTGTQTGRYGIPGYTINFSSSGNSYSTSAAAHGTVLSATAPDSTTPYSGAGMGAWQGVQLCRNCPAPPTP